MTFLKGQLHCFNRLLLTVGLCLSALVFSGLLAVSTAQAITGRLEFSPQEYRLGPGDLIELKVIPQDEFSGKEILVRSDGRASFPGIGDIPVANKTTEEVATDLRERLVHWLKHPSISVSLSHPRPITVYLAGAVMNPGSYQMITDQENNAYHINDGKPVSRLDTLLSNVLANAGGVKTNADLNNIQVKRASDQSVQTVNFWKFLKEGAGSEDIWINPGDSIYVPEAQNAMANNDDDYRLLLTSTIGPKTIVVRVLGEVPRPDVVELDARTPYLSSAVSRAGGFAPQASRHVVAIRRFSNNTQFSTLFVDPSKADFVLRPNDVIYIGENKFYKAGRFMQQAAYILSPFQSAAQIGQASAYTFSFGGAKRINNTPIIQSNNAATSGGSSNANSSASQSSSSSGSSSSN